MTCILTAFEKYCQKHGITGEDYQNEIFPVFAAGYTAGQASLRRGLKHEERLPTRVKVVYSNLTKRGNPQ